MSAGTGNPFVTTDTGSSLRGIEIEADVMLKGTEAISVVCEFERLNEYFTVRRNRSGEMVEFGNILSLIHISVESDQSFKSKIWKFCK